MSTEALTQTADTGTQPGLGAVSTAQTGQTAQTASTGQSSGIGDSWEKSWIKPDFTLDPKALDKLPEHRLGLKEVLSRQKSFDDVLGVLQNAQMLSGKKGLAPLPPGSPANVVAERKALLDTINGVPPKASDYQIARPEFVPESQWNPKLVESTSNWAHKHSVSPAALKELTDNNMNLVKEQIEGQKQYETQFYIDQQKSFDATIRQENIPADRANALAERGATALGLNLELPEDALLFKGAKVKLMGMRHAMATSEDHAVTGQGTGNSGGDPVTQANDIVQNPTNPLHAQYWNREGKFTQDQQKAAVAKVTELHRLAQARKK